MTTKNDQVNVETETSHQSIKKKKIKNFKISPPEKGAFTIETPPDIPKMHSLIMLSGKRGGGKTCALANYIAKLKSEDLVDRVKCITPTYASNKSTWDIASIDEEDIHEPEVSVLRDTIVPFVEDEKKEWDLFLENKEVYKKFKADMRKRPITHFEPEELMEYQDRGFFEGPPKWKYKNEVPPRLMLLIDDCMGTDLMSKPSAKLVWFCIRHRHIAAGTGISIAMCVQSYCALGGVPRPIRENATQLWLFKLKDENQRKHIHDEIGSDVSVEKFDEMLAYSTAKPFGFLMIDFNPKTPEQMFRKNFDEYLY